MWTPRPAHADAERGTAERNERTELPENALLVFHLSAGLPLARKRLALVKLLAFVKPLLFRFRIAGPACPRARFHTPDLFQWPGRMTWWKCLP
jgi:hypothetical protein